jgi:hypothetical protein
MNVLILLLTLAGDPATCPMHAQHTAVDTRGDTVMGFAKDRTEHRFRLLSDGGAIEVRSNDANDVESIRAVRKHLREIASEFTAGDFTKPGQIHARIPNGVPVMKQLASAVTYKYEELERGGRVRLSSEDERGVEAIHQFLRFQIADHRTGDSGKVE